MARDLRDAPNSACSSSNSSRREGARKQQGTGNSLQHRWKPTGVVAHHRLLHGQGLAGSNHLRLQQQQQQGRRAKAPRCAKQSSAAVASHPSASTWQDCFCSSVDDCRAKHIEPKPCLTCGGHMLLFVGRLTTRCSALAVCAEVAADQGACLESAVLACQSWGVHLGCLQVSRQLCFLCLHLSQPLIQLLLLHPATRLKHAAYRRPKNVTATSNLHSKGTGELQYRRPKLDAVCLSAERHAYGGGIMTHGRRGLPCLLLTCPPYPLAAAPASLPVP